MNAENFLFCDKFELVISFFLYFGVTVSLDREFLTGAVQAAPCQSRLKGRSRLRSRLQFLVLVLVLVLALELNL